MNRIFRRAVIAAGSLGVAGGIALAPLPASAAPMPVIAAWGAHATGAITIPQVALATPGHTPVVASNANYSPYLATGRIVDRATPDTALSRVESPLVTVSPYGTMSASQVTSWCNISPPRMSDAISAVGGASVFSGAISTSGGYFLTVGMNPTPVTSYNPPQNPAPNTRVFLWSPNLRVVATITFNKQTISKGGITVSAIYVSSRSQTLGLGTSSCAPKK